MEWWIILLLFFVLLIVGIFIGIPVAFAFLVVNLIVISILMGFESGINMFVLSAYDSVAKFSLTPIPLFLIMGELLFHSGLAMRTLDVLSKWLGRIPGRLSILSVGSGTLFAALSGSSIANTSMLGSILVPEMSKRGYHMKMIIAPILASGLLAAIIPPSATAVLLGGIGKISIGDLLIAGIIPGILLSLTFIAYFIFISWRDPSLAPAYEVDKSTWKERFSTFFIDVLPMTLLIVMVLGLFFFGIATPTESAALGAIAALILPIFYRCMSWEVLKKSVRGTVIVSGMILMIMATSSMFSQLLAYTGATRKLVEFVTAANFAPLLLVSVMILIVLILGTFIEPISIMMITLPLFMPIVATLNIDPVWFGILMLIGLGMGNVTPPFGLLLFVMKGVVPKEVTMMQIYKSVISIIVLQILVMIAIMLIPEIATWLPSLGAGN